MAALPGELRPLVKGWRSIATNDRNVRMWLRPGAVDEVLAVCAGMGQEAARRAFAAAEGRGTVELVLSVGWAGALDPNLKAGTCSVLSEVIDAQTGERFALTNGKPRVRVVTTARVADEAEKRRLAAAYGAVMVDMEAAAIARLAQARGIPMMCAKAVSDGADMKLPDLNPFIDRSGQMRMGAFVAYILVRPLLWRGLIQLGRQSAVGAKALAATLEQFLIRKDWDRANRTGEMSA